MINDVLIDYFEDDATAEGNASLSQAGEEVNAKEGDRQAGKEGNMNRIDRLAGEDVNMNENDRQAGKEANAKEDDQQTGEEADMKEEDRPPSRVRAFTWAPALPHADYSGIVGTQPRWGQHLMAVANDDNQIAIVIVESPTSSFGTEEGWNAEVMDHFAVESDPEALDSVPGIFDDLKKQQRYVSHIAWSPWTIQGDWFYSVLAYATNDDVRVRIISYTHNIIEVREEIVYPDISLRYKGPLEWSPRVRDGDKLTLALFGDDGLTLLTVSTADASILDRKTHDLDGRWDEVSGVVWDGTDSSSTRLHFSSVHSTLSSPTAALKVFGGELVELPSPNWREQISDTQALFSAQNDLKGNAKSKVWGLCSSPLGDFIAACHTAHPSDMLEYGPPKERTCAVAISNTSNFNRNQRLRFPAGNVSAEGIAFTLRKWLENRVEDTNQVSAFAEEMLYEMIQTYGPARKKNPISNHDDAYSSTNIAELTVSFKRYVDQLLCTSSNDTNLYISDSSADYRSNVGTFSWIRTCSKTATRSSSTTFAPKRHLTHSPEP